MNTWHLKPLLVQGELRYPPGNFQETWKFPGVLEKSRGPGFFQVLEISRTPGNFQGSMCIIHLENSRGGYRKVSFSLWMPILSKWIYIQKNSKLHKKSESWLLVWSSPALHELPWVALIMLLWFEATVVTLWCWAEWKFKQQFACLWIYCQHVFAKSVFFTPRLPHFSNIWHKNICPNAF